MVETHDSGEPDGGGDPEGPPFPIVGVGASAGGLQALEELFSNLPDEPGLAFVVVTHQHPGRESLLSQLIGRKTALPVTEVREPVVVERDHVYVIAPGHDLSILRGELQPTPAAADGHPRMPIDRFLRSLAEDQMERAVGVILSGTGSDGSLGVKAIKAELGMVMVQTEATARYGGMPHAAIMTEVTDHVLPAAEMPAQLVEYARVLRARAEGGPGDPEDAKLGPVFALIRERTRHDFSQYKDTTIRRRIARRMSVHHLRTVADYLVFLREHPEEIDLLFKELLIGVTSFFRDPDAWEALRGPLGELVASKADDDLLRVWVPGCSTGEEAYSLAILMREVLDDRGRRCDVQVFSTDLDPAAIDVARAGLYPAGIAEDVSAERVGRFFARDEDDTLRVRKDIRDMLVFAPQNVIADPPFTKLDVLSCRNLLIYLDAALQRRLLPIFHYALKPGGLLFLGSSESLGASHELFEPLDKRWKIFRRREVPPGTYVTRLPAALPERATSGPNADGAVRVRPRPHAGFDRIATQMLLGELVPPTLLVRERGDVVYVHGRTGQFLEPAPGAPDRANVFNMAREGLQISLAAAMRQAADSDGEVVCRSVPVKTNGDGALVDLRVKRLDGPGPLGGLLRVSFELAGGSAAHVLDAGGPEGQARILDLERELQYARESHQGTIEELETANEDLKSTNEELQSTNEELQSTNEELETSKEEMQSLNEELQTVNAELQEKVEALSRANDDMRNLLNGTDIATVFLDPELRVKRFTEPARHLIRLIPSDVGRPIADLASNVRYDGLVEDCERVLRTLSPEETAVEGGDGASYLLRILPYRTTENVIDGVVLTYVDVTKFARLEREHTRLLDGLRGSHIGVLALDADLVVIWACPVLGHEARELVGRSAHELLDGDEGAALEALLRDVLGAGAARRERLELIVHGQARAYDFYVAPTRADGGVVAVVVEPSEEA